MVADVEVVAQDHDLFAEVVKGLGAEGVRKKMLLEFFIVIMRSFWAVSKGSKNSCVIEISQAATMPVISVLMLHALLLDEREHVADSKISLEIPTEQPHVEPLSLRLKLEESM